jgi:hypothetical protein
MMRRMTRGILLASALAAALAASACHRSSPAPAGSAPAAAAAGATTPLAKGDLEIIVNGKPSATWRAQQIAAAGAVAMTNQNGESREGYPVKALTKTLLGKPARVVAVASAAERVPIDEKSWNERSLVLRMNHHGEYKALWVDEHGSSDEAFLKGVRRLELVQQ